MPLMSQPEPPEPAATSNDRPLGTVLSRLTGKLRRGPSRRPPAGPATAPEEVPADATSAQGVAAAQIVQAKNELEVAAEALLESDSLLLDEQEQRLAAQVSEEHPYGVAAARTSKRSDVRRGFAWTLGGLLAIWLGLSLHAIQHELILLLVAAFIAIGLDPAVRWLVRHGLSRSAAVAVIAVVFLGLVGAFAAAAYAPLAHEATQLINATPKYATELQDQNNALGRLNLKYHVTTRLADALKTAASPKTATGLLSAGTAVLSFTLEFLLTLVLVIYFLVDLPRIKQAGYRLVPLHARPRFGLLTDEVITRVGGYVLGNVATSVVAAATSYVLLSILGVPYALVLSILTGILDLIPLIGSTIGGLLAAVVALAAVSPTAAIIVVIYHVIYRVFADYMLNPWVLRKTVDVSPLVTIVAVIVGGGLLGIVGALIAVPTAAAIQLILLEVVYPARDADR